MRDGILLRTFEVFLNFKIGSRAGYKTNRDERIITMKANDTVLCSLHTALMSWKLGLWATPANLQQVYAYGTIGVPYPTDSPISINWGPTFLCKVP